MREQIFSSFVNTAIFMSEIGERHKWVIDKLLSVNGCNEKGNYSCRSNISCRSSGDMSEGMPLVVINYIDKERNGL